MLSMYKIMFKIHMLQLLSYLLYANLHMLSENIIKEF
jgi:hypothetical protein